jgi:adenosylcobinamide-GDP ribazoletransferase
MGNERNSLPLQGASSLASEDRYAGAKHASRNPCYTSNKGHFFIHFRHRKIGSATAEVQRQKQSQTQTPAFLPPSYSMNPLRHFLLALQFFTRIPVTGRLADWVGFSPAMLRASAAYFPAVGWIVGGVTALCFYGLMYVLPAQSAAPLVAACLSTVLGVMVTGAFHEDGLADLADGLGGHVSRERALEIMKDSRIGSYGAVALVLALLAKVALLALLAQVDVWLACVALFAAHVWSRCMPLLLIRSLQHVGDTPQSKSKPLADRISFAALVIAAGWVVAAMVLVVYLLPQWIWCGGMAAALLACAWMWRFLKQRLDGFTGDALGATQQVCELAFYLGVLLAVGRVVVST